tara:strand:- start:3028 stop:3390 length:363 start_codon:yes stop_codon:yes gene_type:complete
MWSLAFEAVKTLGSKWLNNRGERTAAKFEKEIQILRGEREADVKSAEGMGTSLKDEYLVLVLTAPLIVIFYASVWGDPAMIIQVKEAFSAMSTLPEWYQWCFMGSVAATFGLRSVKTFGK